MYTLCSHCDAPYEVSPEALAHGRGQLHCTGCGRDFDGLERISRALPAGVEQAHPAVPAAVGWPADHHAPREGHTQGSLPLEPTEATSSQPTSDDSDPAVQEPATGPAPDTEAANTAATRPDSEPGVGDAPAATQPPQPGPPSPEATPAARPEAQGAAERTAAAPASTLPPVFQWLEQAAAAAPEASLPPTGNRTDALVEVLTAHADFIEPPGNGVDGLQDHDTLDAADHTTEPPGPGSDPAHAASALGLPSESLPPEDPDPAHTNTAGVDDDNTASTTAAGPHSEEPTAIPDAQDDIGIDILPGPQHPATASELPEAETDSLAQAAASAETDHADPFHPVLDAPTPSFIPTNTPNVPDEPAQRRWPAWLAVLALLISLGLLSLIAERDTLAADARWRPWLERTCEALRCTLAPWHEPAAMQLMTRDVRPHPSVPGALLISASFRNQARWAQPWPQLDLTLSDLNGRPIAQRQFQPDQYLGIGARESLIQPGQTASVTLEVRDPGKQAVAFEFDFR